MYCIFSWSNFDNVTSTVVSGFLLSCVKNKVLYEIWNPSYTILQEAGSEESLEMIPKLLKEREELRWHCLNIYNFLLTGHWLQHVLTGKAYDTFLCHLHLAWQTLLEKKFFVRRLSVHQSICHTFSSNFFLSVTMCRQATHVLWGALHSSLIH